MSESHGATREEWLHFDLMLGLTADLLPVVANLSAAISPQSKMKALGKTPSRYNGRREVAGIATWTHKQTTAGEVTRWASEPDYGICLQTRHVKALDIDVDDVEKVHAIMQAVASHLHGRHLPRRWRANSGKCLLAFRLDRELPKRVVKVEGGMIEFLSTGQQFIAAGTHVSGARYQWDWHDSEDFPTLSLTEFESLWQALAHRFASSPPSEATALTPLRRRGPTIDADDPFIDKLAILGWGRDGGAYLTCPWKDGHSIDSGVTETVYYPRGTNGYELGHFKCLHASCASRSDGDFITALRLLEDEFEVIAGEEGDGVLIEPVSQVKAGKGVLRRNKYGSVEAILDNLCIAVSHMDYCGWHIAYDSFLDDVFVRDSEDGEWQAMDNEHSTRIQRHLESKRGFKPISSELLRRAIDLAAKENQFDSAQIWLNGLLWDGVKRVDHFLDRYLGAEQGPYTRAVSRYMWSALAGRVLEPGIKIDMVPILEGAQGVGKSSAVEALAPTDRHFTPISFTENEDNLSRKMRGVVVGEIGELRGLKTRDAESIKSFITRRIETWVPKFKERKIHYPRRLLFIGTTNQTELFTDETGHRRWLPVHVDGADLAAIKRDRDQLWAEGRELFMREGVCYAEAEALARDVHDSYTVADIWEPIVKDWLEAADGIGGLSPKALGFTTISDVLRYGLGIEAKNLKGLEAKRLCAILKSLGWAPAIRRVDGRVSRVWEPAADVIGMDLL